MKATDLLKRQHKQVKTLFKKIEKTEAKMKVLSELVEHHADEEEKDMFKLAQKLGKDELEDLGARMEQLAGESGTQRRVA